MPEPLDDERDTDTVGYARSAMMNQRSAGLVRQASVSARFDGSHHFDHSTGQGSSLNSSAVTYTYQGSRGVTAEQVETLVDAVLDLHERALLCQGGAEGSGVRVCDNSHQRPSSEAAAWEAHRSRLSSMGRSTPRQRCVCARVRVYLCVRVWVYVRASDRATERSEEQCRERRTAKAHSRDALRPSR